MVMTVAGIANPIVQDYKYDSLYRLIEGEEKNNTTENAGQNWTLPARPAAERRQSLAVRRKPTESDRIPNPSRRATAHRILDFANPQELRVHARVTAESGRTAWRFPTDRKSKIEIPKIGRAVAHATPISNRALARGLTPHG